MKMQPLGLFLREISDYKKLFNEINKPVRKLVFYSEKDISFQYFEGYINYVLENSDLHICYITSDYADPILRNPHPRIKSFYINLLIVSALSRLDAKVLVMTMLGLDRFHIRRSPQRVNLVYVFHSVGSTHLQYHKYAFDYFDTIFCVGAYDYREIRKSEELYKLKAKNLILCGYNRIERIYSDYQERMKRIVPPERFPSVVLVAPSWHSGNILESCIGPLIAKFQHLRCRVIIRPHPEFVKRKHRALKAIENKIKGINNIALELPFASSDSILDADILITDWSGIAYEYAFGTERPVLFINTACKYCNRDYRELGIEPIEFTTRGRIGRSIELTGIHDIDNDFRVLMAQRKEFQESIRQCRSEILCNWLGSEKAGGEYLISCCQS